MSRLRTAGRTAMAAVFTIIPAVFVHEVISFAVLRSHIRWSDVGCTTGDDCTGIGVVLFTHAMLSVPIALVFLVAGAALARSPTRRWVLAALWLAVCAWALVATASGYRSAYGATWLWHEPFRELMYHPLLTPVLILSGLVAFDLITRRQIN